MTAGSGTKTDRRAAGNALARYRREQQALATAAEAVTGGLREIEAGSHRAIAAAAQGEWWHRVLARVDAALDDDLAAVAPGVRTTAVRAAWEAQRRETPAYLLLASLGAGTSEHETTERRYARLLALFAGTAAVTDEVDTAAEAGLTLVHELSDF